MNISGKASENDISSFQTHAWPIRLQEKVFGTINFVDDTNSVGSYCGKYLSSNGYSPDKLKPGLKIRGEDITALLLNQSLEYFQKALCNYFAQYLLALRGFSTWAAVTNYYSSFFSIHALLCLQGKTITRITLNSTRQTYQIFPTNLEAHEYVISGKGFKQSGDGHLVAWNRFYDVYDKYRHPVSEYEYIYKTELAGDPRDESQNRNRLNYMPFEGFREMIDQEQMEDFKEVYLSALEKISIGHSIESYLDTLRELVTDSNFGYFAKVALRLLFVSDIFRRLGSVNNSINSVWLERLPKWKMFARSCASSSMPPKNFIEDLPRILGQT